MKGLLEAFRIHPKGLVVVFGTEAWERFGYDGMRALLVLYLVEHLAYERAAALEIHATYTWLVYLTPLFGGLLYGVLVASSIGAGLVPLAITPSLERWMHGRG